MRRGGVAAVAEEEEDCEIAEVLPRDVHVGDLDSCNSEGSEEPAVVAAAVEVVLLVDDVMDAALLLFAFDMKPGLSCRLLSSRFLRLAGGAEAGEASGTETAD